ncbi:multidrug transporter MdtL [Shewanella sp. Choline-02u-19]|uniref:MFS transporter n=1 Tax=unclassified Shewanella TaxID=196818 RepID=UPI000C332762|nr:MULTISPECIES: MFS transporter [unclassified Shewanella]PKH57291.1 multidrug transporter MdtL [Shewanella sp. Bg11-22]PKI29595.1 multidrug transporter MdtL [Shewanella sp. Choline-02u-19]
MFRYLLCSFALVLLYPTAIDLYLVGLPQIAQDLGASESQLHLAFSIYLAGMAATMLFAGRFADAVGRKPVAIVGATIFIIASALCGAADSTQTFLIARFAQGIGAGSCYVVAFAILRDTLDDQRRAKVLSMLNGITCIIPVIAPVIGHLIMLKFPWQSLFTTMTGIGILVCILSIFILKETKPDKDAEQKTDSNKNLNIANTAKPEMFLERYFISRLIITAMGVTTILTYVNVSPMLIMGTMGFDRGEYSSVMALTALVSMTSSFLAPLALSWLKQSTLMLISQCVLMAAALVLVVSYFGVDNHSFYLVGFGLTCSGFAIGFGVAMNQALSPFSLRAGVASSLLGIAQVCSSGLYIWLMGLLGVSPLNMLLIILLLGSLISLTLILLLGSPLHSGPNEKIVSTA